MHHVQVRKNVQFQLAEKKRRKEKRVFKNRSFFLFLFFVVSSSSSSSSSSCPAGVNATSGIVFRVPLDYSNPLIAQKKKGKKVFSNEENKIRPPRSSVCRPATYHPLSGSAPHENQNNKQRNLIFLIFLFFLAIRG